MLDPKRVFFIHQGLFKKKKKHYDWKIFKHHNSIKTLQYMQSLTKKNVFPSSSHEDQISEWNTK